MRSRPHIRVARVRGRTRGTHAVCAARAVDLNGATLDDNPDMDILSPVKSKHHKTGAPAPSRHRATAVLVSPSYYYSRPPPPTHPSLCARQSTTGNKADLNAFIVHAKQLHRSGKQKTEPCALAQGAASARFVPRSPV